MAAAPTKRRLVTLEDSTIIALALNDKAIAGFPFLRPLRQELARQRAVPRSGCGRCGNHSPKTASLVQAIKGALAGMDTTKKNELKGLLNAEQVRIIRIVADAKSRGGRKAIPLTF